jgi:hypothetical protein
MLVWAFFTYFIDMPYWATASYPDFHTKVTSHAFVACKRHDKKADTAFPPTGTHQLALFSGDEGFLCENIAKRKRKGVKKLNEGDENDDDDY